MADVIHRGGRQTRIQALDLSGENVSLSRPPLVKERLNTLVQKQYIAEEVGQSRLILV